MSGSVSEGSWPPVTRCYEACDPNQLDWNLAFDDALLERSDQDDGPSVLRLWEFPRLAVVLGASGRRDYDVDLEACRRDGVLLGRRGSGGGTVLLGPGVICLSVVLPIAGVPDGRAVDRAQIAVLARVAESLSRALGDPVEVHGSGDLTLSDRKFAGSAQRRLRRFLLVHASILYEIDLDLIPRYLREPPRQPSYRRSRSHDAFLTRIPLPRSELITALKAAWIDPNTPTTWPEPELEAATRRRIEDRFGQTRWIERF